MSISNLTNATWLNAKLNSVTSSEVTTIDLATTNLLVENLSCTNAMSIQGDLEITSNTNPFISLNPTANQLLGVGANNNLQFFTIGSQGGGITSISTATPSDLQITEANNVVNINYIGENNGITSITTSTPSDLQITESNNIVTINYVGTQSGGISSITTSTPSDLQISESNGTVTINYIGETPIFYTAGENININASDVIALDEIVNITTLNTNNLSITNLQNQPIYSLPNVQPQANDYVLSCNTNGVCQWVEQETGGQSYLSGTNINFSGATNNVINLDTNIDVNSVVSNNLSAENITVTNSQNESLYTLPNVLPTNNNNQVLSCSNTGVCSWIPQTGGGSGITEVNGTVNQIVSQEANNIVTLSLPEQISLTGNEPQIQLQNTLATNTLILADDSINLNNVNNNIRITPSSVSIYDVSTNTINNELNASGAYVSSVNLVDSSLNTIYSLPSTIGLEAQVLSCNPTTKVCYWANQGGGTGGVQSVTANTNAQSNLTVNNTSPENPIINFTNIPKFTSINIQNQTGEIVYSLTPEGAPNNPDSIIMFDLAGTPDFVQFPYVQGSSNITVQNNTAILNDTITLLNSVTPTNEKSTINKDSITFTNASNQTISQLSNSNLTTQAITICNSSGTTLFNYPNIVGYDGQLLGFQNGNLTWLNQGYQFINLMVSNEATFGTTIDGKNQIQVGYLVNFDDNAIYQSNDTYSSFLSSNILKVPQIVVQESNTADPFYVFPMTKALQNQSLVCIDGNGTLEWQSASNQSISYSQASNVVFVTPNGANNNVFHMNNPNPLNPIFNVSSQSFRNTLSLTNANGITTCQYSLYDTSLEYLTESSTLFLDNSTPQPDGYYLQAQFTGIDPKFIPQSFYTSIYTNGVPYEMDLGVLPVVLRTSSTSGSTGAYENFFLVDTSYKLGEYSSTNVPITAYFIKDSSVSVTIFIRMYYPNIKYQTDNLVTTTSEFGDSDVSNSFSNVSQPYLYMVPQRTFNGVVSNHNVNPYTMTFSW